MKFRIAAAALLFGAAMAPCAASADMGKAALVIGNAGYVKGQPLSGCDKAAHDTSAWLRLQGFDVDDVFDGSSVAMRSAIGDFVTRLSGTPHKTAIVYVCSYAAIANQRLFLLPVDWDAAHFTRIETQGVILKALLNTLAGTNGVLFADLGMMPGKAASDAIDQLQAEMPAGVHFALVARNDREVGSLGKGLPALLTNAGQDWGKLSSAFLSQYDTQHNDRLVVFSPLAGPMPPLTAAAAPALVQVPAPAPASPPHQAAAATVPSTFPAQPQDRKPTPSRAKQPASPPKPIARSKDSRMGRIQAALAHRGYYAGSVTGALDGRTRRAIQTFQASLGDAPSGQLTRLEIVELLNAGP
jgi:hypothetical protein